MDNVDDLRIGIAGEHLVCADLIIKNYSAFLSDQGLPYDIVADINSTLIKVQVKTTRTHKAVPQRKDYIPSYLFYVKRCGKGGRKRHQSDVDLYALVALDTKQIGYVLPSLLPSSLMVRVDAFRGKYQNEVQENRANKVFELKEQGLTNTEISRIIKMDKSVVTKVLANKSRKRDQGIYFSDLLLEKIINKI